MVKSDLCYMKGAENADCDFDHGGYFLIKGAEKVNLNYGFFQFLSYIFMVAALIDFLLWHLKWNKQVFQADGETIDHFLLHCSIA